MASLCCYYFIWSGAHICFCSNTNTNLGWRICTWSFETIKISSSWITSWKQCAGKASWNKTEFRISFKCCLSGIYTISIAICTIVRTCISKLIRSITISKTRKFIITSFLGSCSLSICTKFRIGLTRIFACARYKSATSVFPP